jgi:hypothetical protein
MMTIPPTMTTPSMVTITAAMSSSTSMAIATVLRITAPMGASVSCIYGDGDCKKQ